LNSGTVKAVSAWITASLCLASCSTHLSRPAISGHFDPAGNGQKPRVRAFGEMLNSSTVPELRSTGWNNWKAS
jgi:hypothetical protein